MGGGASKQQPAASSIDLQLIDQQLEDLFKFKILLLGAGESGQIHASRAWGGAAQRACESSANHVVT